jgi:type VI secretion system secreted protein VgrG
LLLSTTARPGTYGSAQGSQLDTQEALAQLRAANDLGQRLSHSAQSANAHPLSSHDPGQALSQVMQAIDPAQDGKHQGQVNGQEAKLAGPDGRTLSEQPVPTFATPLMVVDSPSAIVQASSAITHYAGQDLSATSQGDVQQSAAHTYSSVSGQTTSWVTHEGGMKVFAANGALSLRAHTDELQIFADKDVTITSVGQEIRILAKTRIELVGGDSSIVLDGGNITFSTPGAFTVMGSGHAFLGGENDGADLARMPDTTVKFYNEAFALLSPQGAPLAEVPFKVTASDGFEAGQTRQDNGQTDRTSTTAAERLKFELRWHDVK